MPDKLSRVQRALRDLALSYPGSREDFPWGDRCYKVRDKIFFFLGGSDGALSVTVKLPGSHDAALMLPFAQPTGYGLGKAGWVSATFEREREAPLPMVREWLDESYRAIAPKLLQKELDAARAPSATTVARRAATPAAAVKQGKAPEGRRSLAPRDRPAAARSSDSPRARGTRRPPSTGGSKR